MREESAHRVAGEQTGGPDLPAGEADSGPAAVADGGAGPAQSRPYLADPDPPPLLTQNHLLADYPSPEAVPPPPVAEPRRAAVPQPPASLLALAGVESGILGAALMFGWFVLYAHFETQYWWGMLNLWGAAAFGNKAFNMGFGWASLAGAGHHLFLHGLGGCLAALVIGRLRNSWICLLAAVAAAALWYLFATRVYWPALAPVVVRVSPQPATLLAYLFYGAALSRVAPRARSLRQSWQL